MTDGVLGATLGRRSMAAIRFIASCSPLFVVLVEERPSDDEFGALLLAMANRFFEAPRPYAVVYGGRGAVSPTQWRMQARWLAAKRQSIQRWGAGAAFAFRSPILQGAMRLVFWAQPAFYPVLVTGSYSEAVAWASERLEERGSTVDADSVARMLKELDDDHAA